ncbi:MAG TPA: hypothetical protein VK923_10610 [Euzebyales bacterium]|nr:hypothetical protein [Euzebyales bacterium]
MQGLAQLMAALDVVTQVPEPAEGTGEAHADVQSRLRMVAAPRKRRPEVVLILA